MHPESATLPSKPMISNGFELLTPYDLGPVRLRNRMVMAPMTRSRAGAGGVPTALAATYYAQRASAGLIVTEATQISPQGIGYPDTPGIHTEEQVEGWRRVTDAVHARGGRIFLQLWHVGRVSHSSMQPGGARPVAPSAIGLEGQVHTEEGPRPYETPRALEAREIPGLVRQFADGARRAREARFDGVELHGANGYLIDQFLRDGANRRRDGYGGSATRRARFLLEVTEAVTAVWGPERVGVRLSPTSAHAGMTDSDPETTFAVAAQALSRFGLGYLHVVAPGATDPATLEHRILRTVRECFGAPLILNGGLDRERGEAALARWLADLVSFAVLFLANPDLPERFAEDAPLNAPDRRTFYGGDERGYTDYPTRESVRAASRRIS
jgi:N-ethylmaleimide reductase